MKTYRVYRERDGQPEWGRVKATVDGRPLLHVVYHSPDGFECGYGGSGPADLALSILADHFGERPEKKKVGACRCWQLHQAFKREFVAPADREGFTVTSEQIEAWLQG